VWAVTAPELERGFSDPAQFRIHVVVGAFTFAWAFWLQFEPGPIGRTGAHGHGGAGAGADQARAIESVVDLGPRRRFHPWPGSQELRRAAAWPRLLIALLLLPGRPLLVALGL